MIQTIKECTCGEEEKIEPHSGGTRAAFWEGHGGKKYKKFQNWLYNLLNTV